jgi:hypothetical protein
MIHEVLKAAIDADTILLIFFWYAMGRQRLGQPGPVWPDELVKKSPKVYIAQTIFSSNLIHKFYCGKK